MCAFIDLLLIGVGYLSISLSLYLSMTWFIGLCNGEPIPVWSSSI